MSQLLDALKLRRTWRATKEWVQKHAEVLAWMLVVVASLCIAAGVAYLFWQRRTLVSDQHVDTSRLGTKKSCLPLSSREQLVALLQGLWFEHYRLENESHYGNWFGHHLQHVSMNCSVAAEGSRHAGFLQMLHTGVDSRGELHSQHGTARFVSHQPNVLLASVFPFVEISIVVLYIDEQLLVLGDPELGLLRMLTRKTSAPTHEQLECFHLMTEQHGYAREHNLDRRVKRTQQH